VVVLTLAASVWNSTSPAAVAKASVRAGAVAWKSAIRAASAWHARRIVSYAQAHGFLPPYICIYRND